MAVLNPKPHRVRFAVVETPKQSSPLVGQVVRRWSDFVPCSAEPNRGTRPIAYADGTTRVYSYAIRLEVEVAHTLAEYLKLGTELELELLGGRLERASVLGYQLYQSYAILWA